MNRNKKSVALLPFPVIAAAAGGDSAEYIMILPYRHSPSVQSVAGNG